MVTIPYKAFDIIIEASRHNVTFGYGFIDSAVRLQVSGKLPSDLLQEVKSNRDEILSALSASWTLTSTKTGWAIASKPGEVASWKIGIGHTGEWMETDPVQTVSGPFRYWRRADDQAWYTRRTAAKNAVQTGKFIQLFEY